MLLARGPRGMADAATAAAVRASLSPGASFVAHLAARGLRVALDAVMPFAHWVTPEIEIRRFDTRFLLARLPEGQAASHDAGETTALDWLTPRDALARCARGEIKLPPPTWTTLTRLARFASIDDAWQWASATPDRARATGVCAARRHRRRDAAGRPGVSAAAGLRAARRHPLRAGRGRRLASGARLTRRRCRNHGRGGDYPRRWACPSSAGARR